MLLFLINLLTQVILNLLFHFNILLLSVLFLPHPAFQITALRLFLLSPHLLPQIIILRRRAPKEISMNLGRSVPKIEGEVVRAVLGQVGAVVLGVWDRVRGHGVAVGVGLLLRARHYSVLILFISENSQLNLNY